MNRFVDGEEDQSLAALMSMAQMGHSRDYEQLLTRAATLLRKFISVRISDVAHIDEVVQETLISIHESRHTFDPARSFASWMFAIAKYRMIDHFRRMSRQMEIFEYFEGDLPEFPIEYSRESSDARSVAADLIASLPERQRQVVELLKLEGLSIREVAVRLSMTETAVKVTAHRAYKSLKGARMSEE